MTEVLTRILPFGSAAESSSLFMVSVDPAAHADEKGNVPSSFLPGTAVSLIVHHDSDLQIKRLLDSGGGDLQRIGKVTRSNTVEVQFMAADESVSLPHTPLGTVVASWFGRESGLSGVGRELQAAVGPCIGKVSYQYEAVQYTYRPTGGLELVGDEQFPVLIVAEYEQIV